MDAADSTRFGGDEGATAAATTQSDEACDRGAGACDMRKIVLTRIQRDQRRLGAVSGGDEATPALQVENNGKPW